MAERKVRWEGRCNYHYGRSIKIKLNLLEKLCTIKNYFKVLHKISRDYRYQLDLDIDDIYDHHLDT